MPTKLAGGLLMKIFDQNIVELFESINKKDYPQRFCFMLFGMFLSALSFNIFFQPYNIVTGGTSGISLITRELFNIEPSLFILCASVFLIILSFIFLGVKTTMATIVGVLVFPIFVKATSHISELVKIETNSIFLISVFGGVISGFASGIILKNGFSAGGTQIINQIMCKYLKISMGTASLILNTIIIIGASFVFGIPKSLCAIISLYISSVVTDRVILGISDKKVFYIVTQKDEEIQEYIVKNLSHSVSKISVQGGYSNKKNKMLMCVIPTNEYFVLKEIVKTIDSEAFFLIIDSYEVVGGA